MKKTDKPILNEATVRRWSKLGGAPVNESYMKDLYTEEEPPFEDEEEEVPTDEIPPAPEGEEEVPVEEPVADNEEILKDVVKAVADELSVDVEIDGEEGEMDLSGDEEIPPVEDVPSEDEEVPPMDDEEEEVPLQEREDGEELEEVADFGKGSAGKGDKGAKWSQSDPASVSSAKAGMKDMGPALTKEALVREVTKRVVKRIVAEARTKTQKKNNKVKK